MITKRILVLLAAAAISFTACEPKKAEPAPTAEAGAPLDTLSYETALRYVKNYEKRAGTVTPDSGGLLQPNSRSIWFPKEKLKRLLDSIDKQGGDGIRFYIATYDKKYQDNDNTKKPEKIYWGYNTLVMVSTKLTDGVHKDYYNNGKANSSDKAGFIVGTTPENRGEMCPPPRDCPSVGATLIQ